MKKYIAHHTGDVGEKAAGRFLRRKGYSIIAQNYKSKIGELDIIAAKGHTLIFIEVKTRTSDWMAKPFEFVDCKKQRKIRNLANGFLAYGGVDNLGHRFREFRFDVISVMLDDQGDPFSIEHIRDAFE